MRKEAIATLVAVLGIWGYVFWQLRLEWIVNPMYAYGWTVPFLAGYLFYERWLRRPDVSDKPTPLWAYLPALVCLLALVPIRVIQEANPDWVKINWLLLACPVAFTYCLLMAKGGFRYLFHFFFPIIFTYTAVAWPYAMELKILQGLMRVNAIISAEFMTMVIGVPAMAEGNLVFINGNWVNVEEACSGIRSLQTAFMMSLFFGEFHLLGPIRRVVLVLVSFLLAFVLNVIRTTILTYLSGTQGSEAVEGWHDPLGYGILFVCIFGLWGLASWMKKGNFGGDAPAKSSSKEPRGSLTLPMGPAAAAASFILLAELSTELWYRSKERHLPEPIAWEALWPEEADNYQEHETPERTYALLKYNEAATASWTDAAENEWYAYYLRWYPGRVSKHLAGAHNPTVCLPASGIEIDSQLDTVEVNHNGIDLEFKSYQYHNRSGRVYVFHALIQDLVHSEEDVIELKQVDTSERLQAVLDRQRNLGQRVIGISIQGPRSFYDAKQRLREMLSESITVVSNS